MINFNNKLKSFNEFLISKQQNSKLLFWIGILIISSYLRFANLAENPGWYSDEGTTVEIAKNLLEGRIQYLAINQSTLLVAKMPLFPAILAGVFSFFEPGITTLRYVTASLGVITTGMLYWAVKDILGRESPYLGFTAAFLYAIYPQAILYSRLGFSYNLLSPLIVGILWFLWKYLDSSRKKWILLASLLVGVGSISDLMMITLAPAIVLIALSKSWKDAVIAIGIIILPFLVYSASMLSINREAFSFDFRFTFFRLGEIPLIAQYPIIIMNFAAIIFKNYWWNLAVIGLFLLNQRRFRALMLVLFFTPLILLARTTLLADLGFYYISPLFPLIAIGSASLLIVGIPHVLTIIRQGLESFVDNLKRMINIRKLETVWSPLIFIISSLLLFLIVFSPFIITLSLDVDQTQTGLKTEIDSILVDVHDAKKVITFVNERVNENDFVLASPAMAWAFNSKSADFQMAVAYGGGETKHFPINIPSERFEFIPELSNATYVVIDPIWRNWALPNIPEVENMVQKIEKWPRVYSSGQIDVYENPAKVKQ